MKEIYLQSVSISETRIDPVMPSKANDYKSVIGTQSFSVELEFVVNGSSIPQRAFHEFLFEKIGAIGASFKIKTA